MRYAFERVKFRRDLHLTELFEEALAALDRNRDVCGSVENRGGRKAFRDVRQWRRCAMGRFIGSRGHQDIRGSIRTGPDLCCRIVRAAGRKFRADSGCSIPAFKLRTIARAGCEQRQVSSLRNSQRPRSCPHPLPAISHWREPIETRPSRLRSERAIWLRRPADTAQESQPTRVPRKARHERQALSFCRPLTLPH